MLKLKTYTKDPKHTMAEHFKVMSTIIRNPKLVGNNFSDDWQILGRGNEESLLDF